MMSALTTAQNLLRVITSEATDITKETRPSRAKGLPHLRCAKGRIFSKSKIRNRGQELLGRGKRGWE
jgi:hypothetical protein